MDGRVEVKVMHTHSHKQFKKSLFPRDQGLYIFKEKEKKTQIFGKPVLLCYHKSEKRKRKKQFVIEDAVFFRSMLSKPPEFSGLNRMPSSLGFPHPQKWLIQDTRYILVGKEREVRGRTEMGMK